MDAKEASGACGWERGGEEAKCIPSRNLLDHFITFMKQKPQGLISKSTELVSPVPQNSI